MYASRLHPKIARKTLTPRPLRWIFGASTTGPTRQRVSLTPDLVEEDAPRDRQVERVRATRHRNADDDVARRPRLGREAATLAAEDEDNGPVVTGGPIIDRRVPRGTDD